jgi:hypothetical protein
MSNLQDQSVRQGETLPLLIEDDQTTPTLASATIIVKATTTSVSPTITKTVNFKDGVADITLSATDTLIPTGDYVYQIILVDSNGSVDILPDMDDCEDDDESSSGDGDSDNDDSGFPLLRVGLSLTSGIS